MKQHDKNEINEGSPRLLARAFPHFSYVFDLAHEIQKTVFLGSYGYSLWSVFYLKSIFSAFGGQKRTPKTTPQFLKTVGVA